MAACVTKAQPQKRNQTSFKKGNPGGPGGKRKEAPVAGTREGASQILLDHFVNSKPNDILDKVKGERPVEYIKAVTALVPRQVDTTIQRNVLFGMHPKVAPANWKGLTEDDDVVQSVPEPNTSSEPTGSSTTGIGTNAT